MSLKKSTCDTPAQLDQVETLPSQPTHQFSVIERGDMGEELLGAQLPGYQAVDLHVHDAEPHTHLLEQKELRKSAAHLLH